PCVCGPGVRSSPRAACCYGCLGRPGRTRADATRIVAGTGPRLHRGLRCENPPVPRSADPPPPAPTRRTLLGAAGVAALLPLVGCGRIALGGPEEYTPPPPGIDDLYRTDLLELLERALAGTEQVAGTGSGDGDPELSSTLAALSSALPVQRTALLTGAEAETERAAGADRSPTRPGRPRGSPRAAGGAGPAAGPRCLGGAPGLRVARAAGGGDRRPHGLGGAEARRRHGRGGPVAHRRGAGARPGGARSRSAVDRRRVRLPQHDRAGPAGGVVRRVPPRGARRSVRG